MKALVYHEFGGPEVLRIEDVPVPEPAEGEVQIKVDGAGMNPVDFKIRNGEFPPAAPKEFPAVILRDFSGVVTKLGPGVTDVAVGDEVYGITEKGSAAEYTVAKTSAIGPRPTFMDPADAAVVPLAAMTAWQGIFDHGKLENGQRVLIHGAAGGVGTFAVQLAKWKGAYVIGTAKEASHSLLKDLGADELIDYTQQRFDEVVSDVDVVLHTIGADELPASMKVLKKGGRLVSTVPDPDQEAAQRAGIEATRFMMQPSTEQLKELSGLIQDVKIRPVIDTIVPFDEAIQALTELENSDTVGKKGTKLR